ncbi:uncharacterized protein AMSG_04735 [Thecamonas trahens ATCC 50062]|uniref:Uncharacterized protein n=1 Tax=Thecamonas trahens ATCC 50062 TaxID=461836 RepID=A0A0L0DA74_THETB|nr:hypothetical protein AMSG_04735 [Thecamonas trahens ATCC 50062]KNC48991.1 hypothetical protein AMSG_04735 [Thecamonas trahens ATCC 50062]|eukprot:XP_013758404.1 hypothetical protein AMSG_04735 [Thecamonas trahens ATCC 50062]
MATGAGCGDDGGAARRGAAAPSPRMGRRRGSRWRRSWSERSSRSSYRRRSGICQTSGRRSSGSRDRWRSARAPPLSLPGWASTGSVSRLRCGSLSLRCWSTQYGGSLSGRMCWSARMLARITIRFLASTMRTARWSLALHSALRVSLSSPSSRFPTSECRLSPIRAKLLAASLKRHSWPSKAAE